MRELKLRQAAAQMVMPRLDGEALADSRLFPQVRAMVEDGVGGFILFGGSVQHTPQQLRDLQALAAIPLLIASDVERGLGQQLAGGTRFPNQRAVASAINRRSRKDVELLDKMLDAVRLETRAAGIHVVFSPVVDVNNNPSNPIICTRAFGDEPVMVSWFGSRYIRGLQKPRGAKKRSDLLACAKHFPGHGDTDQDSHSVLPVIRAGRQRLNRVELPPFREAVKSGVGMVMVAHLLVPALDPEKPTTFSKKIVTSLLREGMEFEGLIVSDALDMGALAGAYSDGEIAVRAVEAGADVLLHPRNARAAMDAVVSAVERGRLSRRRIDESVERIRKAKERLGLFDKPAQKALRVDYGKHGRIAREIGRKAPHIARCDAKMFSLAQTTGIACFVLDDDNHAESGHALVRELRRRFPYFSVLSLTPDSAPPESLIQDSVRAAEAVILAVFSGISAAKGRSGISEKLRTTAEEILRFTKTMRGKSVVISFDSPYILDQFKNADVCVAAYDRMDDIQQAVAELLAGEKKT
jgi:beta-glucosidase-like glycosyl hydrolase